MRFDTTRGVPASELLATLDADELTALFRRYGEEPKAGRIARAIVDARRTAPVATAEDLAALVERVVAAEPAPAAPDPSRDARLPGAPDRGQRGARRAPGGPRGRGRPAPARRPARRPQLPLARGPHRQALLRRRAARLRLSARAAGLRLRPEPPPAPPDPPSVTPTRGRGRGQPTRPQRPPAGRRAPRRLSAAIDDGRRSPHEQASPGQPAQGLRPPPARGPRAARARRSTRRRPRSTSRTGARARRPTRSPSSTRARRASASRRATDRWPSTRAHAPHDRPAGRPRLVDVAVPCRADGAAPGRGPRRPDGHRATRPGPRR